MANNFDTANQQVFQRKLKEKGGFGKSNDTAETDNIESSNRRRF
jgi:hypothetical protein